MENLIFTGIPKEEFKSLLSEIVRSELSSLVPSTANKVDELLTEKEASEFLKVSRQSLSNWRRDGSIVFERIGCTIRYRKSDLLKKKSKAL